MGEPDKSHPSYGDGYYTAFGQEPFDTDRADDEQYALGFAAGERAAEILKSGGMSFDGESYSVKFPIPIMTGER